MVCTSQGLAAQAGLDTLKAGGNAIDAAVTTAAAMTVLEPTSNGLGSDAFALVWLEEKKELLESLELYYRVFFLGEEVPEEALMEEDGEKPNGK